MSDQLQNALLIAAVVCAVLALLLGGWLVAQVTSLRRQRFVSVRALAEGSRRSLSSRQGEQPRFAAPAVRTGVDSLALKRALDRAASRQQKALEQMRAEIEDARRQVQEVSREFGSVRQQASTDTQSIQQVSTQTTSRVQTMEEQVESLRTQIESLGSQLNQAEQQIGEHEQAVGRLGHATDELRTRQDSSLEDLRSQQQSETQAIRTLAQNETQELRARHEETRQDLRARQEEAQRELRRLEDEQVALTEAVRKDRSLVDVLDRGLGGVATAVDELRAGQSAVSERAERLDQRVGTVEQELGGRVDTVERSLADRIEQAVGQLAERIGGVEQGLGERVGTVEQDLGQRIGLVDTEARSQAERLVTLEGHAEKADSRLVSLDEAVRELFGVTAAHDERIKVTEHRTTGAIADIALVRYDAFGDMGGRMSFSVALLDAVGDGIVISSLNGRAHSQTYAKSVTEGRGNTKLTDEELQAVTAARGMDSRNVARQ